MTQAKRPPSVLAFFGSELRRLRSAAGLSQEELGQRISYSGSLVGLIETARQPRVKTWPPAATNC
jgi:transcriptional regulator with XRE-family HTH domain